LLVYEKRVERHLLGQIVDLPCRIRAGPIDLTPELFNLLSRQLDVAISRLTLLQCVHLIRIELKAVEVRKLGWTREAPDCQIVGQRLQAVEIESQVKIGARLGLDEDASEHEHF